LEASVGPKWFYGAGSNGSAISAINVVLGGVCPRACKKMNELLAVRFQRCLLVPLDSRGPWKHLLARRGYVKLVPVVCIFNQKV